MAGSKAVDADIDFGVDMARQGLWSEALFRFQQADKAQPNDGRILNNMAVAYEAVGNFEKALECYKRALQADPGNSELKRNYSAFSQFYQAFQPVEGGEEDSGQQAQKEDDSPPPTGESDGSRHE
ncbi:MAG: tetratricopeptide repeat protein [Thermoanaerobaculia bacterium]